MSPTHCFAKIFILNLFANPFSCYLCSLPTYIQIKRVGVSYLQAKINARSYQNHCSKHRDDGKSVNLFLGRDQCSEILGKRMHFLLSMLQQKALKVPLPYPRSCLKSNKGWCKKSASGSSIHDLVNSCFKHYPLNAYPECLGRFQSNIKYSHFL